MAKNTVDIDPLAGRVVGRRRYQVVARIAQGGMAIVYRAYDRQLDRVVAIKVPRPEFAREPHFAQQFAREARAAARLTHPNVVSVFDSGEEQGLPFIVMEYVKGQTLRELLERRGRLDVDTTASVLGEVAEALDHAHHAGVAHLDVKPENVLLTAESVKVADFGLVRAIHGTSGAPLAGTVQYLAPEVLRGGVVDGRADIYALGVLAFECLTGRTPFDGANREEIAKGHLYGRVPPPSRFVPAIPAAVDAAIERATHPDPGQRYQHATQLTEALGAPQRRLVDQAWQATAPGRPGAGRATAVQPPTAQPTAPVGGRAPVMLPPRPTTGRYPKPARRRGGGGRRAVALVLALLLLAGAGAATYAVAIRTVAVPNLRGQPEAQAIARLRALWLRWTVADTTASRFAKGEIADQSVRPGSALHPLSLVVLHLSSGLPNLAGKSPDQAQGILKGLGLKVHVKVSSSASVPQGSVIGTDPPAGAGARADGSVDLLVNSGPVNVPDVHGDSVAVAEAAIGANHLNFRLVNRFSNDVPQGLVIGTDPPAGQDVAPGTTVSILVSKGADLVRVPKVIGLQRAEAFRRLQNAGLKPRLRFLTFGSRVIDQNPGPGERVPRGSDVELTLNIF